MSYKSIAGQLNERRVDRERFIDDAVHRVGAELQRNGIQAEVTGRAKHIHSIWRKMQRKSLSVEQAGIEQLFDLRAIRVLVDTVAECYTALGAVHSLWTHIPREFDDYVHQPQAERLPLAAHGGHRTRGQDSGSPDPHPRDARPGRTRCGRALALQGGIPPPGTRVGRPRHVAAADPRSARRGRRTRIDPHVDRQGARVRARLWPSPPRGDIVELPAGSTPLDFAYQIHTQVGHRCRGAKVDGRIVPLTYAVRSGDRIEVLTARHPRPSRDWLNPNLGYLGSSRSRAKVRHWFKHQDRERNVADGQDIWDREVKRLGARNPPRDVLAERFNAQRFEDFLAALGRGDVSVPQLAGALQPYLPAPATPAPKVSRRRRKRSGDVRISGVGDLLTQMSQCCKPLPNDPIVGLHHAGTGREHPPRGLPQRAQSRRNGAGASHRRDVERGGWRRATPVEIMVGAYDRKGLLRDVTAVCVERGGEHRRARLERRCPQSHRLHAPHRRGSRHQAAQPPARSPRATPQRVRLPAARLDVSSARDIRG